MDHKLAPFVAVIAIFIVIALVIIAWFNYRLKKRIIDSGPVNQDALGFLKNLSSSNTEPLKWGCVVFSGGLGLVIIDFIPYGENSSLPFGLEAMFIAAGFLVYYILIRRQQS